MSQLTHLQHIDTINLISQYLNYASQLTQFVTHLQSSIFGSVSASRAQ